MRPVLDRVKESVFDVLGDAVEGVRVADLYAGIGSFGIEALSRGAASALFVERHRATAGALGENLRRAHLEDRGAVKVAELPGVLRNLRGRFGLIFIDPPFRIDTRFLGGLFRLILDRGLLEEDGLVVYRHSPHGAYEPPEADWSTVERRGYGDSIVEIYRARRD